MIYIHIPFCERKCNYCAFNSKTGDAAEKNSYVDALIKEINLRKNFSKVETIYFGGGTPTTLTLNQLEKIIGAIRENFLIDDAAEITIEANPGTVDENYLRRQRDVASSERDLTFNTLNDSPRLHSVSVASEITIEANPGTVDENYLRGLKCLGFNRLSLGVQSFDDALLKILGRIHDSRTAIETVELAKKYFDNVSVDLMYGLPNQTLDKLRRDLEQIKSFDVQHVSIYGLEIEEGTKFFALARAGNLPLPDENLCADMYELITATLPAFGYRRYEISNFAKENFVSRHNLGYWTGKNYIGVGAGAHSFDGKRRTSNIRDVATYIKKICAGENISVVEEIVTRQAAMEEFCFLGLRKVDGISAQAFKKIFGAEIGAVFSEAINKNQRRGLLMIDGDKIFLTERGLALGNEVFADFLL